VLRPESRKSRSQGLHTLAFVLVGACMIMVSCFGGSQEGDEADHSAFGDYVHALDSSLLDQHLTQIIKADTFSVWSGDKVVKQRYKEIARHEQSPLWFTRAGVLPEAGELLSYLRQEVTVNGLDTMAFYLPQIAEDLDVVEHLSFDSIGRNINEVLARLDYHLSKAYVRYTIGQRHGFVSPALLMNKMQLQPDSSGYVRLFDYQVPSPDYQEAIQSMMSDDRMAYLLSSHPSNRYYQILQEQLPKVTDKENRRKLLINMERFRWSVKQPDENGRMVLVNIPSLQLWAVGGDSVLNMRICCGATATKTPLLHSAITHFQTNPDWIIPQKIVASDIVRHAGDSAYYASRNYYIVDRQSGDTVNPKTITSEQLLSKHYRVGQKGGPGNSLGRIVFRFKNNFSVYLHDTNNPSAFKRKRRTLSHGCIRVQKPFDLACFLLPEADDWKKDRLRISMDIPPETDMGMAYLEEHHEDPRPFRLLKYQDVTPNVPVYLMYYTAYPNPETGVVETWPDLYGYDKAISRSMKQFLPQ